MNGRAVAVLADGTIGVAGQRESGRYSEFAVACYGPAGEREASLAPDGVMSDGNWGLGRAYATSMAAQPDGRLVVCRAGRGKPPGCSIRLLIDGWIGVERRDRLPSGEAGMQFMPIRDLLFAKSPAQAYIAVLVAAWEVDQAGLEVLQFDANAGQFVDVVLEAVKDGLELGMKLGGGFA